MLVPSVGALLSHATVARVITAKVDLSVGVPLSHSDLRPLEAPAPLEMLFAPILNKYRARAGVLRCGVRRAAAPGRGSADGGQGVWGLGDRAGAAAVSRRNPARQRGVEVKGWN